MPKIEWKAGNMIYPVPAALVSCGCTPDTYNVLTIAWTGTVCTNPPMTYISVRPTRHSYSLIMDSKSFVINIPTESLVLATDYCGVKSGSTENKWKKTGLTPIPATHVSAPMILECPVNIECRVTQMMPLGSHHMILAEVVAVHVEDTYIDEHNKFHLDAAKPICYSHGQYFGLGPSLGKFGYAIEKKRTLPKKSRKKQ